MEGDIAVEAQNLVKIYRPPIKIGDVVRFRWKKEPVVALDGVNARFKQGLIHGIIGPNGAGKSTLLRLFAGLLQPTQGQVRVFGLDTTKDTEQVKGMVGLGLTETRSFFLRLSGYENLRFFGILHGLEPEEASKRARELLQWVGLSEKSDKYVWSYSTGMLQRLSIARSLIHKPRLLLFDEITRGLDIKIRLQVMNMMKDITKNESKTVILTIHDMSAIEYTSDIVWVLAKGKIISHGSFPEMKKLLEEVLEEDS